MPTGKLKTTPIYRFDTFKLVGDTQSTATEQSLESNKDLEKIFNNIMSEI